MWGHKGMGQRVLGSAILHHLEGYHVQNLDLASLLGQSVGVRICLASLQFRTPELMIDSADC